MNGHTWEWEERRDEEDARDTYLEDIAPYLDDYEEDGEDDFDDDDF